MSKIGLQNISIRPPEKPSVQSALWHNTNLTHHRRHYSVYYYYSLVQILKSLLYYDHSFSNGRLFLVFFHSIFILYYLWIFFYKAIIDKIVVRIMYVHVCSMRCECRLYMRRWLVHPTVLDLQWYTGMSRGRWWNLGRLWYKLTSWRSIIVYHSFRSLKTTSGT